MEWWAKAAQSAGSQIEALRIQQEPDCRPTATRGLMILSLAPRRSWGGEKLRLFSSFVPLPSAARQTAKKAPHGFLQELSDGVPCDEAPSYKQAPNDCASPGPRPGRERSRSALYPKSGSQLFSSQKWRPWNRGKSTRFSPDHDQSGLVSQPGGGSKETSTQTWGLVWCYILVIFVISLVSEMLLIPDEKGLYFTVEFHMQFLLAQESSEQKSPLWPPSISLPVYLYLISNYVFPSFTFKSHETRHTQSFLTGGTCYPLTQTLPIQLS